MSYSSLDRRQMLMYLGLGMASMGGTIACTAHPPQSSATSDISPSANANASSSAAPQRSASTQPMLPEFQDIDQWLNSAPLSIRDLKGNVVLIQIWTFGCINCQRTLPSILRWHQQYAAKGLRVIGIHTPEFGYERDVGNVKRAVQQHGITYPIAIDNRFTMWKAYNNEYWPHLFLADRQGVIQYDHIGEGAYDVTEQTLGKLLG
ncbi:thioredoxin family protein [Alkalinema pantanalense CENA528]|uniref:thioredoxin family protein n=1 Tax=Alkalinema pantanalense TaxID=1620705 RepID=UPI003D6E9205